MGVSFLSPLGLLVALAAAVPLFGFLLLERRAHRVRRTLQLPEPTRRQRLELGAAFAAVALLLGLAAAQPVLSASHDKAARSDAEVLFVFDVSRSMEASLGRSGPSRLARAKSLALQLRAALGDVPAGLAGMTDRTLPYLFPTANQGVFDATVKSSVGIEQPPPAARIGNPAGRATTLGALASVAQKNYFTPGTTRRLLIVLSDYESNPFVESNLSAVFRKPPSVHTIFIRFWGAREKIYRPDGRPDVFYRPDPTSARTVKTLADATRGRAFMSGEYPAIVRAARSDLGSGKVRKRRLERARTPIAGWVALAAVLPLGLVLRRRNI